MDFDWMMQCYPGAGEHRDVHLQDELRLENVMAGVDTAEAVGLGTVHTRASSCQ